MAAVFSMLSGELAAKRALESESVLRCAWPTIKSSMSRKWATVERPLPPIFKFRLPLLCLCFPVSLQHHLRLLRLSAARDAQFHFILLGCNRRRFSRSESMAATAAAVKKSLFGCPEIRQHSAFQKGKAVGVFPEFMTIYGHRCHSM